MVRETDIYPVYSINNVYISYSYFCYYLHIYMYISL